MQVVWFYWNTLYAFSISLIFFINCYACFIRWCSCKMLNLQNVNHPKGWIDHWIKFSDKRSTNNHNFGWTTLHLKFCNRGLAPVNYLFVSFFGKHALQMRSNNSNASTFVSTRRMNASLNVNITSFTVFRKSPEVEYCVEHGTQSAAW